MKEQTNRKKHKKIRRYRKVGYSFLSVYAVAAVILITFCVRLGMVPGGYLAALGGVLAVLGGLFVLMQRRKVWSIISDVLCVLLTVCCIAGCFYIGKADTTVRDVARVTSETDEVGVYVLTDDPAQDIEDAADYRFGMAEAVDRENTDATVADIEEELGRELDIGGYGDMFKLLDALKEQEVRAIILNSAYVPVAADAGNYAWVTDGLRQIASYTHETGEETAAEPSEDNNSFIVYLSGIDTYGEVSARSRSDVNILAVVNTETKNVLLLSTPRDYYVDYSETGGAKDKLTHAGIYGVDASIDALERLYGVDVNYYLRVNFTGFTQIIDALGGVDVYSQYDFTAGGRQFSQGYNTVNGTEALSFARERYSFEDGDIQRGRNQMEVIRAVIKKAASSSLLANYAAVMDAVSGSFETNMPQEEIAELVRMQLSDMASWNITTYTAAGQVSTGETYSAPGEMLSIVIPDEASVQEAKNMINSVLNGGE